MQPGSLPGADLSRYRGACFSFPRVTPSRGQGRKGAHPVQDREPHKATPPKQQTRPHSLQMNYQHVSVAISRGALDQLAHGSCLGHCFRLGKAGLRLFKHTHSGNGICP